MQERGTGSRRRGGKCDREKERDQRGRENPLSTRLAENNITSFLQREEQQMRAPCSLWAFTANRKRALACSGKSRLISSTCSTFTSIFVWLLGFLYAGVPKKFETHLPLLFFPVCHACYHGRPFKTGNSYNMYIKISINTVLNQK